MNPKDDKPIPMEKLRELHRRKITVEVSILESEVLEQIRSFKYGKFTLQIMDGVPMRMQIEQSKWFEGGKDFDI